MCQPFKKKYNIVLNDWLLSNPGRVATYHQIPSFVNKALVKSFTPKNIMFGFCATGIYPLNRNTSGDDDFLPSLVTERPNTDCDVNVPSTSSLTPPRATCSNSVRSHQGSYIIAKQNNTSNI